MNVENINRLIDHLKKVPRKAFNLDRWFEHVVPENDPLRDEYHDFYETDDGFGVTEDIHPAWAAEVLATQEGPGPYDCNTVACIAGHAALLATVESGKRMEVEQSLRDFAQDWLGLTSIQTSILFTPYDLPTGYFYSDVTPQIAVRVCEHLRDTGEVDWWVAFGLEKPVGESQ